MLKNIPIITKSLLIINVLFYLFSIFLEQKGIDLNIILGSFYPESVNFKFWQPLTHMFMHASGAHIAFNMFALFMFGSSVENVLGRKRFLIIYFVSGFGAFILFNLQSAYFIEGLKTSVEALGFDPNLFNSATRLDIYGAPAQKSVPNIPSIIELCQYYITPMVGASGAIYGLLVAFGMIFPDAKLVFIFFPAPIKAKFLIPALIVFEIILGLFNFSWNPVANFAHLGGALTGFILIYYWKKKR